MSAVAVAQMQMGLALGFLGVALVLYVSEWVPIELASLLLLCGQLLVFTLLPVPGPQGGNLLGPEPLLAGFGNTALLTVMALLVVGEGLIRTGVLDRLAESIARLRLAPRVVVTILLLVVIAHGAFISDTSVVVMFLPVMQALAARMRMAASHVMLPLSFAAVLGGMLTLIGSSTNLMVSSALIAVGDQPLRFFEQTPMALPLVAVGTLYILLVLPRLIPERGTSGWQLGDSGKQFVSELTVESGSSLVGAQAVAGRFPALPELTVHLIIRHNVLELPPYENVVLGPGDQLLIAGTRKALTDTAARHPGLLAPPEDEDTEDPARPRERDPSQSEQVLVEAMVPPTSRFAGQSVTRAELQRQTGLTVVGIERRARMMRAAMSDIVLQPGDVLLVHGRWTELDRLRLDRDLVVISGSVGAIPKVHHTRFATITFLAAVAVSALGLLPIVVAAIAAAAVLVVGGALTPRQAVRAIDHKVVLLVVNALALSRALEVTGGGAWVAQGVLGALGEVGPLPAVAVYFGVVAAASNLLSHNACALLFTPIGVGMAHSLGVDTHMFAVATVLAANCSFATPIGHQVHLLVMGPGHYRFVDYVRCGLPLVLLLWAVFVAEAMVAWS